MKHRQVRQSTWETNSSSTHAYTLYFPVGVKPEFKPIYDGTPIYVGEYCSTGTSWRNKAGYVATYLLIKDRNEDITKLEKLLSDFCGGDVKFNLDKLIGRIDKNPEYYKSVENAFEPFGARGPYGDEYGSTPDELEGTFAQILATDENTLAFICSSSGIEINEYYDG